MATQAAARCYFATSCRAQKAYSRKAKEKENSIEDRQCTAKKIPSKIRKGGEVLCHKRRGVVSFCGKYTFVKSRRDSRAASQTPARLDQKCDSVVARAGAGAARENEIAGSPANRSTPAMHSGIFP